MIDLNWHNFKAKFNGRETSVFEQLAYMLFCAEHNIKVGIFRFKNQTGIETEPITVGKQQVAFQSKYYETNLSDNKADMISSLKKAKRENSGLHKILFYVNQEFSESSTPQKKKPQYLIDIEDSAKEAKVKIEWRVPSHFEVQLAQSENQYLAEYFFQLSHNRIDFLNEIRSHAENILFPIRSEIAFKDKCIKIDRLGLIEQLEQLNSPVTIISGEGGSGKTALIKDFFSQTANPVYVFKAAEFNLAHIGDLFSRFGSYALTDFIEAHQEETQKIVVIDSAERLADLEDQDAFKELLSALLKNKWQLFFTTRLSYLNDLTFQLLEIYRLDFGVFRVNNLTNDELTAIGTANNFQLPENQKLRELITNLFYLDEYLFQYKDIEKGTDVATFRETLWQKKIQNSTYKKDNIHLAREQCFVSLVKARCASGHFYIDGSNLNNSILSRLSTDEIIQYDEKQKGYFITHDIYEEWALDKIIDWEFSAMDSFDTFFAAIGTSLIIRRAFRHWLSNQLSTEINRVRPFIEGAFTAELTDVFWKDELLISILLAEYAEQFFTNFESVLLANDAGYLKKIIFLLRIACKEIDRMLYQDTSILDKVSFDTAYLITKPKGEGWHHCIKFVYDHRAALTLTDLPLYFALLDEWTTDNKTGPTTRYAALTALHFYEKGQKESQIFYGDGINDRILSVILAGTEELKTELTAIVNQMLEDDIYHHSSPYDDILESILKAEFKAIGFIRKMPKETLKLALKFWYMSPDERHEMDYGSMGTEEYYNIPSRWSHEYSPASAYQTPIYYCLESAFAETIKFIIAYTNRAIEAYANSGYDDSVFEVNVHFDAETTIKQFISIGIWNIFRGSGSPVSPYLLQSYHMALEKYLLGIAEVASAEGMERWLIYLVKHSRSASITAIVASVVTAFPDKFFKVAAILFGTYEFMQHDNYRLIRETEAKSIYAIGAGMNVNERIYEDERLATVDQPHRKMALENLALNYQFFRNPGVTDEQAEHQLETIQGIIDMHYDRITRLSSEDDELHAYRLLIARIDRRKMNPTVERQEDQLVVHFNPELDDDLLSISEIAQQNGVDFHRYTQLKLWGSQKFDYRENYEYPAYDDPQVVMADLRKLLAELNSEPSDNFIFFNRANTPYGCYGLITTHIDSLSGDDMKLCCDVALQYAKLPLQDQYDYQIADGVEVSVHALTLLYGKFPELQTDFDAILLLILLDTHAIGAYKRVCDYAIEAIVKNLYPTQPEHAMRIFQGYLLFAIQFKSHEQAFIHKVRTTRVAYQRGVMIDDFIKEHNKEFGSWRTGELPLNEAGIDGLGIEILETLFQLIPIDSKDIVHLNFARAALPSLTQELLKDDHRRKRDERIDHKIKLRFSKKAAYFLLKRDPVDTKEWVTPFVTGLALSRDSDTFLQELLQAEDILNTYDQFWLVWECFYPIIKKFSGLRSALYLNEIIHTYLLAWPWWKKSTKSWHSLKDREKLFYARCAKDMGSHPAALYGMGKILNEIATPYIGDGMIWISDMLAENDNLSTEELEVNTVYYLEVLVRKYVYLNRTKLKGDRYLRTKLLIILEFLIYRASVNAYLLREEIL